MQPTSHLCITGCISPKSIAKNRFLCYFQQEENNNNIPNSHAESNLGSSSSTHTKNAQMLLEMRNAARKFNIAAANPLLAEKLSAPSGQHAQHNQFAQRNQVAPPVLKVEQKG